MYEYEQVQITQSGVGEYIIEYEEGLRDGKYDTRVTPGVWKSGKPDR